MAAVILAVTAAIGAYTPMYLMQRDRSAGGSGRSYTLIIGNMFSAGVMVSAGFCHLLGEAVKQMPAMQFSLATFLCGLGYLMTLCADRAATLLSSMGSTYDSMEQSVEVAVGVDLAEIVVASPHIGRQGLGGGGGGSGGIAAATGGGGGGGGFFSKDHHQHSSASMHQEEEEEGGEEVSLLLRQDGVVATTTGSPSAAVVAARRRERERAMNGGGGVNGGDSGGGGLRLASSSSDVAVASSKMSSGISGGGGGGVGAASQQQNNRRNLHLGSSSGVGGGGGVNGSSSVVSLLSQTDGRSFVGVDLEDGHGGSSSTTATTAAADAHRMSNFELEDGGHRHNKHQHQHCGGGGGGALPQPSSQQQQQQQSGHHHHHHHQQQQHPSTVSFMTAVLMAVALCFHSLLEGAAMGAQPTITNSLHIFIAIVSHKGLAAYALGSSIAESNVELQRFWSVVLPFTFASPVGIYVGYIISDAAQGIGAAAISALASGTFLYVAFMEVIPRELHDSRFMGQKLAALLVGFGLMSLLAIWA